jgi:fucose permease
MLGGVGLLWVAMWWWWFRSDPAEMTGISATELDEIGMGERKPGFGAPWGDLFRLPQLGLIALAYFCYAWGSWFYFGWFTTWLVRGAGFSIAQMGLFASFPFLMGMLGNLVGGVVSERLVEKHGRKRTYRWVTGVCLVATSALLLAMSIVRDHTAIVVLATLGFGVMDLMLPSAWAMCMSIGGQYGGTATGVMNTAGNLGGWVCTIVFGYVIKATGNYDVPLRGVAAMVLAGAVLFTMVDCTKGLGERTP